MSLAELLEACPACGWTVSRHDAASCPGRRWLGRWHDLEAFAI